MKISIASIPKNGTNSLIPSASSAVQRVLVTAIAVSVLFLTIAACCAGSPSFDQWLASHHATVLGVAVPAIAVSAFFAPEMMRMMQCLFKKNHSEEESKDSLQQSTFINFLQQRVESRRSQFWKTSFLDQDQDQEIE